MTGLGDPEIVIHKRRGKKNKLEERGREILDHRGNEILNTGRKVRKV